MQRGYLELKLSWELFQKPPEALSEAEHLRVAEVATRQNAIEQRILSSCEAASVVVPPDTLSTRLFEIRQRYQSERELADELERVGLDEEQLAAAVERDLSVEALLDKVAARVDRVSAVDAEIYYHLHPKAFHRPETRRLRHILITFDTAGERIEAAAKLEALRTTLKKAKEFGEAALRHSQCPTATQGGQLGVVRRKQLYPELEEVAFLLSESEISAVIESPIGLHIIRCDEVLPCGTLPFTAVREKLIERLTDDRRREVQRRWIKDLVAA
ncbi:PpiC-type peptidyl-prolyl cis-trans isomerase [Candidatus Accumulibacter aalborgensis]|uniref:peptidylprolyl isomerase n=1 Tax=Candidatus Accumulibacter aalborgensis TaxID=1860102 RepID=A0A1A8XRX2_9PROT|nr:nitrogen fixation protein NifM [Candidatus Accumulibacter aalborgensis]SBT07859.1 PpiC-type peptidyl-prolyl cis-trans isomerase [Candidatus Accumulibacter aalborgensis]